ncbi:MAG: aldehyde dehydrogenase family protein [Acidobacteria bacterium]|nr:MAG: aldehyde dehydrogenase family protein [Acidobacteriota bacterium]REK08447.1 MAG: aldehyde dehydrogenase family protein [Acidobacteriota bacterium]
MRGRVEKTYKLYVGGQFPRTESGRSLPFPDPASGERPYANICRASRKDFRDAVVQARAAQAGWARRSAYNRAQILYRAAEMLEGRAAQFEEELRIEGLAAAEASAEVAAAVDRLVYYAGWADKVQQVFSSVNPVASSHFNFSILEPTGVVAAVAPDESRLLGLVSVLAPIVVGGNTVVALAGAHGPLSAITFGEVLHTSDLPGGVVNLLTGQREELLPHFASHRDVNALVLCGGDSDLRQKAEREAVDNLKRFVHHPERDWSNPELENPYLILETQEVKTTWHPIGS